MEEKPMTTKTKKSGAEKVADKAARFSGFANMEEAMAKGKTHFEKFSGEAASLGKENVEALVESGNIFAKGFEGIMKAYVSLAQDVSEKNAEAFQKLMGCKTVNEYAETQNKVAQESFDDFMAGATKLSELGIKLATDAFEPLNEQITRNLSRVTESVAA